MRPLASIILATVMLSLPSDGAAQAGPDGPVIALVVQMLSAGLLDEVNNRNPLGRELCEASGQGYCSPSTTIGAGLCYLSGQGYCSPSTTVGEGFSMLGMGAPSRTSDTQWAWDEINHSSGRIWRCRGIQTGQFAPDYRCSGMPKVDYRWPGE